MGVVEKERDGLTTVLKRFDAVLAKDDGEG